MGVCGQKCVRLGDIVSSSDILGCIVSLFLFFDHLLREVDRGYAVDIFLAESRKQSLAYILVVSICLPRFDPQHVAFLVGFSVCVDCLNLILQSLVVDKVAASLCLILTLCKIIVFIVILIDSHGNKCLT